MSSGSTNVVSMPSSASVVPSSVWVPPYRWALATTWEPAPAMAVMARNSAAWPLAVATAPIPPSKLAMRSSNAAVVGLAMRV